METISPTFIRELCRVNDSGFNLASVEAQGESQMTHLQINRQFRRRGFTMIELLVVMGVILFLMSISIVALGNALTIARQRATKATILKVHGLMQQRVEAFHRGIDKINLQPAKEKLRRDLGVSKITNDNAYAILVKKQIYQSRFPQNFYEYPQIRKSMTNAAVHNKNTESAALLYWILTKSEIYGVPPVDESAFGSSEVRDTDGDGLPEFVDGWGHPLRYYRWPTHLFRPGTTTVAPGSFTLAEFVHLGHTCTSAHLGFTAHTVEGTLLTCRVDLANHRTWQL